MSKAANSPKDMIRSDVATVELLDLLVQKISETQKTMTEQSPEGIVDSLTPITVTAAQERRVITPPYRKKWFSVSVVNDGPNECSIIVNSEKSTTAPYVLREDETFEVDMGVAKIEDLVVYCDTGSALLRIRGVR